MGAKKMVQSAVAMVKLAADDLAAADAQASLATADQATWQKRWCEMLLKASSLVVDKEVELPDKDEQAWASQLSDIRKKLLRQSKPELEAAFKAIMPEVQDKIPSGKESIAMQLAQKE
eukprot:1984593-Karenia_brevis.AAC.1